MEEVANNDSCSWWFFVPLFMVSSLNFFVKLSIVCFLLFLHSVLAEDLNGDNFLSGVGNQTWKQGRQLLRQ